MGWNTLGAVRPNAVKDAAMQMHFAAQWLGRFGRGLATPKDDDSHTSFLWRDDWQAFLTDVAPIDGQAVQFGLRTTALKLFLVVDDEIVDDFELHGRRDAEAGAWARAALKRVGASLSGFDADAPYEMPAHKLADGGRYESLESIAALSEIARAYDNAQPVLEALKRRYADIRPGPSDARTWPHHFDTGLIITLEEDASFETARAVGAGLAVPDDLYDEFYFYSYPWPRHKRDGLPKLSSAGKIQTAGFFGAVLPVSRVIKQKDQPSVRKRIFRRNDRSLEIRRRKRNGWLTPPISRSTP